ncbi:perilipin-2-like [Diadema antillarum]|uniref:perilipin-2-like n=1 Tax=Diadema antillarum TaxID=105358 RepID=UPI003A88D258
MSEIKEPANMPAEETKAVDAQSNVINRVAALPMVSSTLTQVTNAYNWTKDKNSLVKYTLEMAESTVAMAATTAKPVVDRLEGPLSAANEYANQRLDMLQEKAPIINDSPDKVLSSIQDGTKRVLDNTKTAGAEQINKVLLTRLGKAVTQGVNTAITLSEFAVDYYLPQEEGNASEKAQTDEAVQCDGDKPLEATFSQASRVTNKVRRRIKDSIVKFGFIIVVCSSVTVNPPQMEYTKQHMIQPASQAVQVRIETTQHTLWKTWDEWTLEEGEEKGTATDEVEATNGEQKTLAIARSLASRLKVLSGNIAGCVRLLPQSLATKVEEGRDLAEALYNSLEEVQTVRELPSNVVSSAKQQLNRLTDITMSLADFLVSSTPLQWLVPSSARTYLASYKSTSNGHVAEIQTPSPLPCGQDHSYANSKPPSQ